MTATGPRSVETSTGSDGSESLPTTDSLIIDRSVDTEHDPAVWATLKAFGVTGRYDSLADAVAALGRRAEAAEAAGPEAADIADVLPVIVRALQAEITGDVETLVTTGLAIYREVTGEFRICREDGP